MVTKKLGDVLKIVRESRSLTIEQLAAKLQVNKNTVGGYERSERLPPFDYVVNFAKLFDYPLIELISLRLVEGGHSGEPLKPSGRPPEKANALAEESPAFVHAGDLGDRFVLVPRYDVRAAAGGGALIHSEQIVDYLAFKADWVYHRLGAVPKNLILIEAWGDSMEPTIADGDLLLTDISRNMVRDNAIYAIAIDGNLMVKRLQRLTSGRMVVISDNARYKPEELDPSAPLHVIGQVVWHGGSI